MSKEFFSINEFKQRWSKVRVAMENAPIDLLMVIAPANINYLIGTPAKGYQELQVLFFPRESGPLTIFTRRTEVEMMRDLSLADEVHSWGGGEPEDPIEALRKLIQEKGYLKNLRIGLEVPAYYLHAYEYRKIAEILGTSLALDATNLVGRIRLVKSPTEIGYARRAAELLDISLKAGVNTIKEGRTERDVSAAIHFAMISAGSDIPSSPMNFLTGPRTAYSHGEPSDRVMQRGDFMHIQYGAHFRRYCCTIGRQFCLGKPSSRMQQLFDVVRSASDACISEMKPGVVAKVPHLAAKKVIEDAGFGKHRIHMTGYALGAAFPPSWVEPLIVDGSSTDVLEPGMIVSVEPPILGCEDHLGARLIENVLITDSGAEVLSQYPRNLIVID